MRRGSGRLGLISASLLGAAALATAQVEPPPGAASAAPQAASAESASPAKNPPTVAPDNPALSSMRMSKIIGAEIKDKEGAKIGEIQEVIVDENGNASLAIVSSGGFLGGGDELRAVPWSELQPGAQGGERMLDMGKEGLEKAPAFESDQWPTLNQEWLDKNRTYYEGR